jgi:phosphoenolpyruvate-protein phosphotransferase (PTS system enzyme I)
MHKGVAVSPGVVVGVAHRVESVFGSGEPVGLVDPALVPVEIERFNHAVATSAAELEAVVLKVAQQLGATEAAIFRTHLTVLKDESLLAKVRDLVQTQGLTALSALQMVLQGYAATFARHEHDFFRERMADVRDVISRIGSHLSLAGATAAGLPGDDSPGHEHDGDSPVILVAHEILPSQAMSLGSLAIAGIVTEAGGGTSHVAILARSRGIPAVSGCVGITADVQSGDTIIVDGRDGVVQVRPDAETIAAYRKMQREYFQLKDRLILNRDAPAASADGVPVELLANINNLSDAHAAVQVGAAGVGLFRTEYLFLTHQDVPDEEEQYEHYRQMVEASPGRCATIRTLDLGGDKTVPYLGRRNEANPFMGWRSIRLSFEHPRLFERQIRAILRAGRHGKVNMLFPMITTLEELRHVNRMVEETRRSLRREGVPFGEDVKTGVMVEVPAAAVCIDALLRETDFISIGSNDLIQYLVAADRDNAKVAHLCDPLSPAIFKVLQMVLEACRRTGTPVTLCGEMAGQPRAVLVLFGMGLRRFSMSPAFVSTIKALLNSVTTAQAERFAHQVLQLKTSEEIRSYLNARLHEVSSDLEVLDFT